MNPAMRRPLAAITTVTAILLVACGSTVQPAASTLPSTSASAGQAPLAAASGWQARWNQALAAAEKEGKVTVNGPPGDPVRKSLTAGFEKAYPGITLDWSGGRGGEEATKLEADRRAGVYALDVLVQGTTTIMNQIVPIKAADPIRPVLILPEVTDTSAWRDNHLEFADKDQHDLVFTTLASPQLIYNAAQVKPDEIQNLNDLLNPKWKGKIVINDPIPSGAGNVEFRWLWEVLGPDKAPDFMRKLKAQAGTVSRDQRQQVEWIARGTYAIALAPSVGVLAPLAKQGLKFGVLADFKDEGSYTSASFGSLALISKAPHPNAATVFVNWLLSKAGQTAYSTAMQATSRRLDVPTNDLPSYVIPKQGVKYWASYYEQEVKTPAGLAKVLKDIFPE